MTKKIFIITLTLVFLTSVLYINSYLKKPNTKDQEKVAYPEQGVDLNGITPNLSTREDLYNKNGDPEKQYLENNSIVFEYKSNNPNSNNTYLLNSDKVDFIKTYVTVKDNIKISNIEEKYGKYENILYGPGAQSGFNLYIYNTKGIAYIGNEYTGDIVQIWYFPPIDVDNFIKLYAQEYSKVNNPKGH